MDAIEERVDSAKILVGLSLDASESSELVSWAIGVAAKTNDTIIALHVLASRKEEKKHNYCKSRLRQAKAFVISILGEFAEISQIKKVKLEAKVRISSSIGKGLTDEAKLVEASSLILCRSRTPCQRNSVEVVKYCLKRAPQGCSVISIGKQKQITKEKNLKSQTYNDNQDLHLRRANRSNSIIFSNALPPLQKLFRFSTGNENRSHSPRESICDNGSPIAVLDGPDGSSQVAEYCSSPSSIATSRRSYSNIWRRLSVVKLFFSSFSSIDDSVDKESDACSSLTEDQKPSWTCFSYEEISRATDNFQPGNVVGRGGYAEVFKGNLDNGQSVAVKRLTKGKADAQKENEFLVELGILGHVFHPNAVYLLGCCIENGLHLVFDLSANGTLAAALHGKNNKFLDWPLRYKIAIGIARGLHYLHKCCRHRIIHRDIKASNILLGPDFEPQISDFGLAKWLPKQLTHHTVAPIEGTFGYLAPEYFMHGIVDEKTDVFAFGVLLLEIVSGRRPVDSSRQSLIVSAKQLTESGKVMELADPKLEGKYDIDQMQRLVLTASYCVRKSAIWRPSMTEVMHLMMNDHSSPEAQIWRMPECHRDEIDDYTTTTSCYLYS